MVVGGGGEGMRVDFIRMYVWEQGLYVGDKYNLVRARNLWWCSMWENMAVGSIGLFVVAWS